MTSPTANRAAALPADNGRTETLAGPFVLNLCSSTTPMALAQVEVPELKRFTFFVSRRFEEGRERFRLHMGYFATLAEAEEWLGIVREIYPGAWAGEAPGKKLRERAAAAAAAQAGQAVGPRNAAIPAAAPGASAAAAPPTRAPDAGPQVPGARAALQAQAAATPALPAPPSFVPTLAPAAAAPARPEPARTVRTARTARSTAARSAAAAPPAATAGATRSSAAAAMPASAEASIFHGSNVREVLAELDNPDETGATRAMPALGGPAKRSAAVPPSRAVDPVPEVAAAAAAELSDTQVLRMLELRREADHGADDPAGDSSIALLKPDDTGTRRALKHAVSQNAPVAFAVQLHWSVQPISLDSVPGLAIFSAYTLYSVEGSRDGRKWYGLRLGFFSDANSAKQVAQYVRSEFNSVAVVPVSPQEKGRATDQDAMAVRVAQSTAARKPQSDPLAEFKLIDDGPPRHAPAEPAPAGARTAAAPVTHAASPASAPSPVKNEPPARGSTRSLPRRRRANPGEVNARERRGPQTLEETLEILGAGELEIDEGRGETLNDSGVRHLRVQVQKNTPFSKLLDRLSDRIRKP